MVGSEELVNQARQLLQAGQYREALPILGQLIRTPGEHRARALSNMAGVLYKLQLHRAARVHAERALVLDPELQPAHLNHANILFALEEHAAAADAYRSALRLDPTSLATFCSYAELLVDQLQIDELKQLLKSQDRIATNSSDDLFRLGAINRAAKDHQAAFILYSKALEIDPQHIDCLYESALSLFNLYRIGEAIPYLTKLIELDPENYLGWSFLGIAHWNLCANQEAIRCFHTAFTIKPNSASAFLNHNFVHPKVPGSLEEVEACLARSFEALHAIGSDHTLQYNENDPTYPHTFHIAYSNINLKKVLSGYSAVLRKALLNAGYNDLPLRNAAKPPQELGTRIRIGFLSKFFGTHTNMLAFRGLLKNFDRSRFEVFIIHTHDSNRDDIRDTIDSYGDHAITLNSELHKAHKEVVDLNLDLLFFTDIGMSGFEVRLANLRSAPIQATGWGIPHTSGISCIDHYVSSDVVEIDGAQEHYSEKLIRLPGLPCCFLSESLSHTPVPREYFFLSREDVAIGCLQGLHKYHPDDDAILEQIAIENPEAVFVFAEHHFPIFTKTFLERVRTTAPEMSKRMHMLKLMSKKEYFALCDCLDFLIDPLDYGSGITFFESSFVGSPILTLEGEYLRNRLVAASYRYIGIDNPPIATTKAEYVALARALIRDPQRRQELKNDILIKSRQSLYDNQAYVDGFMNYAEAAVNDYRSSSS